MCSLPLPLGPLSRSTVAAFLGMMLSVVKKNLESGSDKTWDNIILCLWRPTGRPCCRGSPLCQTRPFRPAPCFPTGFRCRPSCPPVFSTCLACLGCIHSRGKRLLKLLEQYAVRKRQMFGNRSLSNVLAALFARPSCLIGAIRRAESR